MIRATAILGLLAAAVLAALWGAELAAGCSCADIDERDRLASGEVAVIGTVRSKRESEDTSLGGPGYEYRIGIERALNSDLSGEVTVSAGASEASCGIGFEVGERIGAFIRSVGNGWQTDLCSQADPADLERALAPFPTASGEGRATLLAGGRFAGARVMALDGRGRVIGYGLGRGSVSNISVCPGSRRVAELAEVGGRVVLAVRDVESLRVGWQRRVRSDLLALRCADRSGSTVFGAGVDYSTKRSLGRATVLAFGPGGAARRLAAAPGDRVVLGAHMAHVANGARVVSIDLRSGRVLRRTAARNVFEMAASPDDKALALLLRNRLTVLDLTNGVRRSTRLTLGGWLRWLAPNRLFVRSGGQTRLYDGELRLLRRHGFGRQYWPAHSGGALYGTDGYRLQTLDLGSGRRRFLAELPDRGIAALVGLPGRPLVSNAAPLPRATMAGQSSLRPVWACARPSSVD